MVSIERQRRIRRVEGEGKPHFQDAESSQEAEKAKALNEYQAAGQEMLDAHQRFFATFAQDVSLRFRMGNAFFIDLEHGEVNLDTRWFAEKGFTPTQIRWAVLHELGHFLDLAQDPEGMMKNFDLIQQQARNTGALMMKKWEEKYGDEDPAFIERLKKQLPMSKKDPAKTLNAVERSAYKMHHTFYNIFDDIFDNNSVARKAPTYEEHTTDGQEVKRLYKEKLFPKTEYSTLPRHLQFVYALLREEMVKDEEVTVSEEVKQVLHHAMPFLGKQLKPKDVVNQLLKPKKGRDTKPSQRYFVIQKTLEPIFQQLLLKDLEEWDPQKPPEQPPQQGDPSGEPQEGDPNPFADDYNDFEQNSPDQIPQEDIDAWSDKHQEEKDKKEREAKAQQAEEKKSSGEKAQEAQNGLDAAWCAENGVDTDILRQFREREAQVAPYLDELSALWQHIIFGSSREVRRGIEGHYKTGTEMDIPQVIAEWPKIEKAHIDEVRVMKRTVTQEILVQKPELIRLRLVLDMSSSVNEEKKTILQQCAVLLLSSLHEFQTQLNRTRKQTKSKLQVDTEAWAFSTDTRIIKPSRAQSGQVDDQASIVNHYKK